MYWREYRSQAHIALAHGVSEPTVCRTISKVEKLLLASGEFALPGKKALQEPELAFEVVIMDATEVPVERPKKSKSGTTEQKRHYSGKKSATRTKRKW